MNGWGRSQTAVEQSEYKTGKEQSTFSFQNLWRKKIWALHCIEIWVSGKFSFGNGNKVKMNIGTRGKAMLKITDS